MTNLYKYIYCIKQINHEANEVAIVECFENYETAQNQANEYEQEYTQAYVVETIALNLERSEK